MKSNVIGLAMAAGMSLALAGCESTDWISDSSGVHAKDYFRPDIGYVYLPLRRMDFGVVANIGAATVIAPGIAATNAHLSQVLGQDVAVIGEVRDDDLLFFRTGRQTVLPQDAPYKDEKVVAYGQGLYGDLREARGTVIAPERVVVPRCVTCNDQLAFTFAADAGPGFSGGPVIDVTSGHIVGITFGYQDEDGRRVMYAYSMKRVRDDLAAIQGRLPDLAH